MYGLLAGATLPVNGCGRHFGRKTGQQGRIAPNVEGLVANHRHTTHNNILDLPGFNPGPANHFVQRHSGQLGWMCVFEFSVSPADRGAHSFNNHCLTHINPLLSQLQ